MPLLFVPSQSVVSTQSEPTSNSNAVQSRCCCRTGDHMASGGADKTVKIWDTTTGTHISSLHVSYSQSSDQGMLLKPLADSGW